jgi:DNA polymerase-3 subunit beta
MKIIVGVDDLASHLKKFELIQQRYSHQSECIFITASSDDHTVSLSATDGSVSLSTTIPCFVETPGSLVTTCKQLSKLLGVLPAREVELTVLESRLQIKTITGEYLLHTVNLEAKPETNFREETNLNIEGKILLDGINYTLFCVSTEEGDRPSICGVNLQTNDVVNRFCTIDGKRLATYEVDGENNNHESDFLITNKVCRLLIKLLSPQDKVSIRLGKESYTNINNDDSEEIITYESVIIKFADTCLKYSLANVGMFPRYDQLIPRQFERKVLVDRVALVSAVENILVVAQQSNSIIKFKVDQDNQEIKLSCECDDVGASEVILPAQVSGDSLTYAFNVTHLLGGLKSFASSEVSFSLNAAATPVIIEPLSVQKRKFLTMPFQIRD